MPPEGTKDVRQFLHEKKIKLDDAKALQVAGGELLATLRDNAIVVEPGEVESASTLYRATNQGLVYLKHTKDGPVPLPLTNFNAKIIAGVLRDDGQETTHTFEIEAR